MTTTFVQSEDGRTILLCNLTDTDLILLQERGILLIEANQVVPANATLTAIALTYGTTPLEQLLATQARRH